MATTIKSTVPLWCVPCRISPSRLLTPTRFSKRWWKMATTNSRVSPELPHTDAHSRPIAACMDDQLVDAIKHLASDPTADTKVRRKLLSILASWNNEFKNDPSLSTIAGLYRQCRRSHARSESADAQIRSTPNDKDVAKKRAKQDAKERARKAEEEARQKKNRPRRASFNFEAVSITPARSPPTSHIVFRRNPKFGHRLQTPFRHQVTWSMRSCWSIATKRASPPIPAFRSAFRMPRQLARPSSGTYR